MKLRTCVAAIVALVCASVSSAAIIQIGPSVVLQDLIDGTSTISAGDKSFVDFGYAATGDNPIAADVNVIPIQDTQTGDFGIRFQAGFLDLPGGGSSDALLFYKVVAPAPLIIGARLQANTQVSGSGGGLVQITETFLPDFTDISIEVFDNGIVQQLADSVMLSESGDFTGPVMMLPVQKDIILLAADDGIAGTVSFVDQLYPQIPEPSALALVFFGMVGFAASRRR